MHIVAALFGFPIVMSDRTHTGIRRTLSLYSKHVYTDNFSVEMSVKINYYAIFRGTGHHREHTSILRFHTIFLKNLS